MFRHFGAENYRQIAILISAILLVSLTPSGNEATHPLVFFVYRTLLFTIMVLCAIEIYERRQSIDTRFLAACSALLLLMWLSYHVNTGSRFEGSYLWYQHVLFGAGFSALALVNATRPGRWKQVILGAVVAIDLIYLSADLVSGRSYVTGPFVNPNYFASFLTVGFAISIAVALFAPGIRTRIGGGLIAVFLFYGLTQSRSRGAVLAALALTGLALLRLNRKAALRFAAIGALALSAVVATSPALMTKFVDVEDPYNYTRPKVWMATLEMIAEYPLLGVGMGQFDPLSIRFSPPVEGTIGRYMKRMGIAHSEYLQYAAEIGIPAALLLFGLSGYLVFLAVKRARACEGECRVFQEAAILTAAGLGAHALVDNNWSVPVIAAGLVVFSVGNVLPVRAASDHVGTRPPLWMTRHRLAAIMLVTAAVYLHSTLIPAMGLYFNEAGHQAFEAGDLDRAESFHRLAAGIIPDSPILQENVGLVYFDRHVKTREPRFLDDAELFYRRAVEADPNAPRLRRRIEAVLIQKLTGDRDRDRKIHWKIVEADREVLERDPMNPFVRKNLAEALYHAGAGEEAERELKKAIEVEPNYVSAYLRLAEWQKESGNISESETQKNKAMSIVARYQHVTELHPYEALLLGRPSAAPDENRAAR